MTHASWRRSACQLCIAVSSLSHREISAVSSFESSYFHVRFELRHQRRVWAACNPFSDLSPNPPENPLRQALPHFRRRPGRGKVGLIARQEDFLLDRTPGNCKKVTLDWHVEHDVYKKHQF